MGAKRKALKSKDEAEDMIEEGSKSGRTMTDSTEKASEHIQQLERLKEKDPEFYEFLKEHDNELLNFDSEDIDDEDVEEDDEDYETQDEETDADEPKVEKGKKSSTNVITSEMVDSWCKSIKENKSLGAVRSLMKAFRLACHYGDDSADNSMPKFNTMTSSVFNKIMIVVFSEMDGIIRGLFKFQPTGGNKEAISTLVNTKVWKNYNHLVKSYLGNALHVLNQMTDTEMIAFTLKRLRCSSVFLAAFPAFLRKYIKVLLHFWGTGGGALPIVSFLFLRDLCIQLGSDCSNECIKGIYKAYVMSCQFVNATKLAHIQFLGNCVNELLGVDIQDAYQHAFVFIRQLGMILREALTMKTKEAFRKVYEWKYINCLELWTGAICAYGSQADFKPLAYPLTQIICGVARLVPTARYFPLRLRCIRMLNRIAASIGTFLPVSLLLIDMLEMKELNRPPTGGVGKAVDLQAVLKVSKPMLKTRSFQEACVFSVIEEVAEHLAQWSYSVAFFELSFIPVVRLRNFCKSTKVERFRREMKQLVQEIEASIEYTNQKRASVKFMLNDVAATSFLEDEKKSGVSPLSQYVVTLRERAQERRDSQTESSIVMGTQSSSFGNKIRETDEELETDDGNSVFSSTWLPKNNPKTKKDDETAPPKEEKQKKKKQSGKKTAVDVDIVEDLILSSDDEDEDVMNDDEDNISEEDNFEEQTEKRKSQKKEQKSSSGGKSLKRKGKFNNKNKSRKQKRTN
ncbi:nucleolar complex-associated protein 2 [Impatiens glandulifera]|uniref:nucleolar complex-associated protein 2 n=1 Tax=Impatiens glandulifera TaxID=253017 RepID=UPI001FB0F780|nr:nucleolar complex-associated protein 2 [Impatiens glandulifera]